MFKIENGHIFITKGDTGAITLDNIKIDGEPYEMQTGDKINMTVRKKLGDDPLIRKEVSSNSIKLRPTDTKNLVVGKCCYDIELRTAGGDVYTIVGLTDTIKQNMTVYPEVTE